MKESSVVVLMGTSASVDLRQCCLDPVTARLEKPRQLQGLAERVGRLVDGKSWIVGGDLEQDAVRLAKVDGPEIVAVLLVGGADPMVTGQLLYHLRLDGIAGGAEGDVVDSTGALPAAREIACFMQIDDAAKCRVASRVAHHRSFPPGLGEAEDVGQDLRGGRGRGYQQIGTVEAADRMLDGNRALAPCGLALDARNGDERKPHAVRILERDRHLAEALLRCAMGQPLLDEAMR